VRQLKITPDRITNRTDNISRYFTDVSSRPILSAEEEFSIGLRAQAGEEEAIEKLISSNLRFVVSVAKQYAATGVLLEDMICQGNIGLCDAARMFDPTRGFKFISFAVWHIRKEILMYLNSDQRTVRIPQNILTDLGKIRRADESILQEEGRYGTDEELQEAIAKTGKDFTVDHIKRITSADTRSVPLESDNSDEYSGPLDWLSSGSTATQYTDESDLSEMATLALSRLNSMQRDIVIRRLGINGKDPETFSTIASRYERTPEWARSLYTKSIRIMQIRLRSSKDLIGRVIDHES
jgi:RNA polymerase primary sigma factor